MSPGTGAAGALGLWANRPISGSTLSKDGLVVKQNNVMVVDGLVETEEVLKAVLEPRGMLVTRISTTRRQEAPVAVQEPSVVILHESDDRPGHPPHRLPAHPWDAVPRVVIGRLQNPALSLDRGCRYLSQPFQYAELVTAIESLLK